MYKLFRLCSQVRQCISCMVTQPWHASLSTYACVLAMDLSLLAYNQLLELCDGNHGNQTRRHTCLLMSAAACLQMAREAQNEEEKVCGHSSTFTDVDGCRLFQPRGHSQLSKMLMHVHTQCIHMYTHSARTCTHTVHAHVHTQCIHRYTHSATTCMYTHTHTHLQNRDVLHARAQDCAMQCSHTR